MSLLTPPNSSHRADKEKENKFPAPVAGPSTRSVVWASQNSIHCLGTPPKSTNISSRQRPNTTKSILKKSSRINMLDLEVPAVPKQRDVTPEPSDPLVDLHYLDHPVNLILSNGTSDRGESLADLITGYSILAARLRSSVSDSTDGDASWPLFQPLRKNTQPFVNAVVRDIGRALVDPMLDISGEDVVVKMPKFNLPSPQKSPSKKKDGMTEEQVKYARDLCTTSHSVIKLLAVILAIPAIYSVFEEKQLRQILTAVLAIPMADELPTPNARKTCALAIWLIQTQRLPASVLQPAADRIAYAIRRGIDGELGKEGKKGSASDGLKAVHDLCVYLPAVFIPAFTPLLPSVLSNLLANTLTLRTQACHALGGFVLGSTSPAMAPCVTHTKIADMVAAFLTTVAPPNPKSPTKATEAMIVRTLRTTINATDPAHVAQGPVWAVCVLASFVALLRSKLCADAKVNRIVSALLSLAFRHKKSSVRALVCIAWRTVTWSYFQPPLIEDHDEGEEEVGDLVDQETLDHVKKVHCKVMMTVVDMQAGISTIAALLGEDCSAHSNDQEEPLRLSIDILDKMTLRGGHPCVDGVDALRHITSITRPDHEEPNDWDLGLLLPKGLFSANPGLLTADFKSLGTAVRPLYDQVAQTPDVRLLTREELSKDWVHEGLLMCWRNALRHLEMFDEVEVPGNLVEIWSNVLEANVSLLHDNDDDAGISEFATKAVKYLIDIAQDPQLDFRPKKLNEQAAPTTFDSDDTIPDFGSSTLTNAELRLRVIYSLWTVMKSVFPHGLLAEAGEALIEAFIWSQKSLVPDIARMTGSTEEEEGERARVSWVGVCVDVLGVCDIDVFKMFWGVETDVKQGREPTKWIWNRDFTRAVWRTAVEKWMEMKGNWDACIVLLGLPFSDRHSWNLIGMDYDLWENLLNYTTDAAQDEADLDSAGVFDKVASFVSQFQTPGLHSAPSTRLVDLLISHMDAPKWRDLPLQVIELASTTMRATYPPEPRIKGVSMWMVRSLANLIENCPKEFCLRLFEVLDEGLCLWLADDQEVWSDHELNYDIIPLYQHILVRVQVLPESLENLKKLSNILDSMFLNKVPSVAAESFADYWKLTYSRMNIPESKLPSTITHCLRAVGLLPPLTPTPKEPTTPTTLPLASAFIPSSPRTPISASLSTPPTAIVKREALSRVASPHRPHKVFGSFPIVPSTPLSPSRRRRSSGSSSEGVRTPLSAIQLCRSPAKRRRLMVGDADDRKSDKENVFDNVPVVASVAERIAELKPKGKKRRFDDEEDDQDKTPERAVSSSVDKKLKGKMKPKSKPVAKKARVPSPAPSVSSNESEDERWVAAALISDVPFPTMGGVNEQQQEESDAENNGLAARNPIVYGSASKTRVSAPSTTETPAVTTTELATPITNTRKIDFTKVPRRSASNPDLLLGLMSKKRKRHHSADDHLEPEQKDFYGLNSMERLPALLIPPKPRKVRPIVKAYTYPLSSDTDIASSDASRLLSSDDDPHLGQVTPHHITSPYLIRKSCKMSVSKVTILKELFGDESPIGSDDSIMSGMESDSPTKGLMTRQLQRMGSDSSVGKSKPLLC